MKVDIKRRTEIECACGETHPILEWSTWGAYAYVPMIECPQAPAGHIYLLDTNYVIVDGRHAYPRYRGKLYVRGRM